jgi:N-acetylglucosaminyl-diphospho-decaprenol L-rhamnosyltransferase
VQHEHVDVRSRSRRRERLPVRPDAERRVVGPGVVLRDDGDPHTPTYHGGVPPRVAVQVVNYRTRSVLSGCLDSVLEDLAGLDHRVLVLDNASGDDLSGLPPAAEVVVAERNLGFGAGHNRLAALHEAEALLILNPDARIIQPRTVARLLDALGEGVAAVGPQLVDASGEVDPRDHGELHGFRARVAQAAGHSHYRRRDSPVDAAWVSGAACLIARPAFDAAGGFDPGFFLYKEEEDLFLRIRRQGGRVLYLPSVRVHHDGGAVASRDEYLAASVARYAGKHIHSPLQRRLMPPVHRAVTAWGGRLDRLMGR